MSQLPAIHTQADLCPPGRQDVGDVTGWSRGTGGVRPQVGFSCCQLASQWGAHPGSGWRGDSWEDVDSALRLQGGTGSQGVWAPQKLQTVWLGASPEPLEGMRPAFTPWAHLGLLIARTTSQGAVRHPRPLGLAAQPQTMHASCSLQRSLFRGGRFLSSLRPQRTPCVLPQALKFSAPPA